MKTIEERAILNLQYEKDFLGRNLSDNMVCRAYVAGATEQKAIDDELCKSGEVSDGCHNELYDFIREYNAALVNSEVYKHSRAIVEFDSAGLELNLIEMLGIIEYDELKSSLSLAFIHFINENCLLGEKFLSNAECKDIEEGFRTQDWPKLLGYLQNYNTGNTRKEE